MKRINFLILIYIALATQSCEKKMPLIKLNCSKTTCKVGEAITCDASQSTNTTSFSWRVDNTEKLDSTRMQFIWTFLDTGKHIIAVTGVNKNKSGVTEEITINVQP